MNFAWPDIGVIAGLLTAAATIVGYIVRNGDELLRLELRQLTNRLDKMDIVLERLSDLSSQNAIMQERILAQGKRQDEADRRANEMSSRLSRLFDRQTDMNVR